MAEKPPPEFGEVPGILHQLSARANDNVARDLERLRHLEWAIEEHDRHCRRILNETPKGQSPRNRENIVKILYDLSFFLSTVGFTEHGLNVIDVVRALAVALEELENGTVHDVLKPASFKNRSPDSSDKWIARALIACMIDFLYSEKRHSRNYTEACHSLLDRYPKLLEYIHVSSAHPVKLMLGWLSRFRNQDVPYTIAQQIFDAREYRINDFLRTSTNLPAHERIDVVLSGFLRVLRPDI